MEHPLHLLIQLEEDQAGVDSCSRYAHAACELRRRVAVVQQSPVGACLLDRREILSLKVLDQHDLLLLDSVQIAHHDRYLAESGQASSRQSTMTSDHDAARCDEKRLQHTLSADRVS